VTEPAPATPTGLPPRLAPPAFAHASEAEMARILDFYAVRWEYEPHTFPILWNLDGAVVESFSPDFWLPDLELYLEMTTLRQRLVRKKNRKLRRLRELYPDVRIKLFYARDFRALMLKYGKLALVEALSGTPGQAPSLRMPAVEAPDGPPAVEEPLSIDVPPAVAPVAAAPIAGLPTPARDAVRRRRVRRPTGGGREGRR
jgi:hypoxanthine phosphoribosyltransferase